MSFSGYDGWKAFMALQSTGWATEDSARWLQINLPNALKNIVAKIQSE
jgi:hypothetical protein